VPPTRIERVGDFDQSGWRLLRQQHRREIAARDSGEQNNRTEECDGVSTTTAAFWRGDLCPSQHAGLPLTLT
jgi:hypothetical protein